MPRTSSGDRRPRAASIRNGIVAAIIIGAAVGCDSNPVAPGANLEQFVALRLNGPAAIPPGGTAQFTAIGQRRDGTTADLSARVTWSSSPPLLTFDSQGLGRAAADVRGETRVSAVFEAYPSQTMTVLLLEPGTFRISGTVTDSGFSISGAAVEVIEGTGSGLRATTNASGRYEIYGVAGSVRFRIAAEGFQTTTVTAVVNDHTIGDFSLKPTVSSIDIGGAWMLSATAAAGCRSILPEAALQGELEVIVAHHDSRPQLRFPGPFTWTGRLVNGVLSVIIAGPEDPATHELLPLRVRALADQSWLEIGGQATATVTRDEISGTIDGTFRVVTTPASGSISCRDRAHSMTMRRR